VVGGLLTSTLLTLVLLPVIYEWMEKRAEQGKGNSNRSQPATGGA
jgi:cobalt-zinc-cadmium resistance protein CzcA